MTAPVTREATSTADDAWHNPDITRQRSLLLFSLVVLIGAAALAYLNLNLERRIDTLETKMDTVEAELASRPTMGDMIVVGSDYKGTGTSSQVCIRYRAFDSVETSCFLVGLLLLEGPAQTCVKEAAVSHPLP